MIQNIKLQHILTTGVCGKEEIFGLLLRIKKKKHISFLQRKRVLNKVYSAKKTIHRVKRPPTVWEKMFKPLEQNLLQRRHKNGQQVSMKKYIKPLVIREIQI